MKISQSDLRLDDILIITSAQRNRFESYEACIEDIDKKTRLLRQECSICYYVDSRIGGSSITDTNCSLCQSEMSFGNTNVDILCRTCAKEKRLCVHCGSDINLKHRRKL